MVRTTHTVSKRVVLASLVLCMATAIAQPIIGKVIGVSDGDTVDVLNDNKTVHRIRLSGIDAPEKAQPFGQRAKEHLSTFVFGKRVEVIGNKIDKYGRTVGKVNGIDANLEQVKAGLLGTTKNMRMNNRPTIEQSMRLPRKARALNAPAYGASANKYRRGNGGMVAKERALFQMQRRLAHVALNRYVLENVVASTASHLMESGNIKSKVRLIVHI
jgi:endonuclease YncB( thermonuclease family)